MEIVEALERGAVVVTGNQRAARALRRGFDRRNRELGRTSWQPPRGVGVGCVDGGVVAWAGDRGEGRAVAAESDAGACGVAAFSRRDEELESLQSVDSLAEMAAEAWRLVLRYDGQGRLRGAGGGADTRAFQRWARAFERVCETEGFLSTAQLEETLRDGVGAWTDCASGRWRCAGGVRRDDSCADGAGGGSACRLGVEVEELRIGVDG